MVQESGALIAGPTFIGAGSGRDIFFRRFFGQLVIFLGICKGGCLGFGESGAQFFFLWALVG